MFTLIQTIQLGTSHDIPYSIPFYVPICWVFFPPKTFVVGQIYLTWACSGPRMLFLYGNQLTRLPDSIGELKNLTPFGFHILSTIPSPWEEPGNRLDRSTINLFSFWAFTWTRGRDQLSLVGLFFFTWSRFENSSDSVVDHRPPQYFIYIYMLYIM